MIHILQNHSRSCYTTYGDHCFKHDSITSPFAVCSDTHIDIRKLRYEISALTYHTHNHTQVVHSVHFVMNNIHAVFASMADVQKFQLFSSKFLLIPNGSVEKQTNTHFSAIKMPS